MSICDDYRNKLKITPKMLKDALDDELITLKELVCEDITMISIQLDKAKAEFKTDGIPSNNAWFQNASAAKKIKGQLNLKIQNELGRRKKIQKEKNREQHEKDLVNSLLKAINLALTPEQKERVLETWRQLRK